MELLEAKGRTLSTYLIQLLKTALKDKVKIITPEAPEARGCQVSFILVDLPTKEVNTKTNKQ